MKRFGRKRERRRASIAAEHLGQHARKHGRRCLDGRLIQRRERQRIPEQLAQPRRLAVANQPALDGLAR